MARNASASACIPRAGHALSCWQHARTATGLTYSGLVASGPTVAACFASSSNSFLLQTNRYYLSSLLGLSLHLRTPRLLSTPDSRKSRASFVTTRPQVCDL